MIAKTILKDIAVVLNRPLLSLEEEAVIVELIDTKINKLVESEVYAYKMETENLTNFINFQLEEGAEFHNILF